MSETTAIVIGAGPAGLMAAETLLQGGVAVTVFDRMPSPGRKLLMAGRGGLNLTHSEPLDALVERYGEAMPFLSAALSDFPPARLRDWCQDLGQATFVGSSGRIFPVAMKASPLLRSWMSRLTELGAQFRFRETWSGWADDGGLIFRSDEGQEQAVSADAVVLALGGASWPRLGSDGRWVDHLKAIGVQMTPFQPSNVGFKVAWSDLFAARYAGTPLKAVGLSFGGRSLRGEALISREGLEGGGIYALSRDLRESLASGRPTTVTIDLRPGMTVDDISSRLSKARPGDSLANRLRKALKMSSIDVALLREGLGEGLPRQGTALADAIKSVPIRLTGVQPLDRAISSAGGVSFKAINPDFMLQARTGAFLAGEMLDWEAPTGGYLLQACFATGRAAGEAALRYARSSPVRQRHRA